MARDKYTVNLYDFGNKQDCVDRYIKYMLNRTNQMFQYTNLPENMNERQLELKNQTHGYTVWCKLDKDELVQYPESPEIEGGVYALWGTLGGVIDLNGDPTWAVVAHPRLKQSKRLKIGEECVIMRNDALCMGLLPLYERYATQLMENDITINMADIQSRIVSLITAGDDRTKNSADLFINDIINGKISIIGDKSFYDEFKLQSLPYASGANNTITNLIELQQYIKASLYNEIGLSANYNMKRESINSGEAQLGKDSLIPLVDDMLHQRQVAVEQINKLFGLNIGVEFHSAWKHVEQEALIEDATELEESVEGGTVNTTETPDTKEEVTEEPQEDVKEEDNTEEQTQAKEGYNRNLQKRAKRGEL